MKLRSGTIQELSKLGETNRIYCFGASLMPKEMCEEYGEYHFETKIHAFVDNAPEKSGTLYELKGKMIPILSVREMLAGITNEDILLITSKYYVDIYEQLEQISKLEQIACYIWPMIAPQYKSDTNLLNKIRLMGEEEEQIPKKIHYFWFGKNPIPSLEQKCIESWKRNCPDYELILWNEDNYDVTKNLYMKQAYEAGKWGFVPDYARLDVIYQYGGIYLDTDVEVLKSFDPLLKLKGFAGFESKELVALGLGFGAKKGNLILKILKDSYKEILFRRRDGSYDLTASPFIQTKVLQEHGLKLNNRMQVLEDLTVLPAECFSPDNNMIPHITENTFSIHHFSGSWTSGGNKKLLERMRRFGQETESCVGTG